jgi:hypothetical protein
MKYLLRLLCISFIATAAVFAHEVLTHQNIGNVAVAYLQQSAPSRPVLPSLQQLLLIGAVQEDDDPLPGLPFPIIGRYYFHFDPSLNFFLPAIAISGSCTSIAWGLNDSPRCSVSPYRQSTTIVGAKISQPIIQAHPALHPSNNSVMSYTYWKTLDRRRTLETTCTRAL